MRAKTLEEKCAELRARIRGSDTERPSYRASDSHAIAAQVPLVEMAKLSHLTEAKAEVIRIAGKYGVSARAVYRKLELYKRDHYLPELALMGDHTALRYRVLAQSAATGVMGSGNVRRGPLPKSL